MARIVNAASRTRVRTTRAAASAFLPAAASELMITSVATIADAGEGYPGVEVQFRRPITDDEFASLVPQFFMVADESNVAYGQSVIRTSDPRIVYVGSWAMTFAGFFWAAEKRFMPFSDVGEVAYVAEGFPPILPAI